MERKPINSSLKFINYIVNNVYFNYNQKQNSEKNWKLTFNFRNVTKINEEKNKMEISYICAKDLLQRAGIYQFAVEISKLAELCFTQKDFDSFYDSILKYIFCGGVYGSVENYIAVKKTKSKTSLAYVFKRLFPPLNFMRNLYQILIKAPIFLPICWVIRGMHVLFGNKSKRIISEMSQVNNMSEEKMNEVSEICLHLGL